MAEQNQAQQGVNLILEALTAIVGGAEARLNKTIDERFAAINAQSAKNVGATERVSKELLALRETLISVSNNFHRFGVELESETKKIRDAQAAAKAAPQG